MAVEHLKFSGISCSGRSGAGLFKLTSDQFGWKSTEPNAQVDSHVQFAGKDIYAAEWQNAFGRKWLLKVCIKPDGEEASQVYKFAGLQQKDFQPIKAHLSKHYKVDLAEVAVATKGFSWGDLNMENGIDLRIMMEDKLGLEIPIAALGQVTTQGKTDLNLQLQYPEADPADEVCHEIRLQVIPEKTSAETLQLELQQKARLSERGEALCRVNDVMLVAPRGKHNLEFFKLGLKLHGKTQTYSLKYKNVVRLFLMDLPGGKESALVVGLDQPLRSGQQSNYFLVFTTAKDVTTMPDLPEEKLKEYNMPTGTVQAVYILIARLFKDLSGRPIVAPASDMKSKNKSNCIRCFHKAQVGFLYPLKKSMIFILKPVLWIRYEEIVSVELIKGMARARSFDVAVHFKDRAAVEFTQMESEDGEELIRFLKTAGVRVTGDHLFADRRKSAGGSNVEEAPAPSAPAAASGGGGDDESDDEDFDDSGKSSSAGDDDDDDVESEDDSQEKPKKKRAKKA